MVGHSMGAMIALRYACDHQHRLDGLALSGALASIDAPAALRIVGRAISIVAPKLGLITIDASLISRDPAVVEAYRSDPLVHHGKLPARTAAEIADTVADVPAPGARDHDPDPDHVRHRGPPVPAGRQRDARRADRRRRHSGDPLRGALPRDLQRARARGGAVGPERLAGCARRRGPEPPRLPAPASSVCIWRIRSRIASAACCWRSRLGCGPRARGRACARETARSARRDARRGSAAP